MPEFENVFEGDMEWMRQVLQDAARIEAQAAVNIPNPAAPPPQAGVRFRLARPLEARWEVNFGHVGHDPFPLPEAQARAENGPELWDKILYAVKEIYDPAYVCIAGGAVRDFTLKEQAKDIDVFLYVGDNPDPKKLEEKAHELGWKNVRLKGRPMDYQKDKKMGAGIVLSGTVDGWNVDLVVCKNKTGEKIVKAFDFHICQHWYDGQSHATKEATFDVNKRQWTPSRALTPETKEHFERVNKRLGGKYKLNTGEPWYMKFQGKEKLK